ncbi:MAG TPA: tRNA lysidine(34) synthetase TilS [Paludibacter sp.]|nr:tRNA lysidine(34) synthetase TilS [Paludibacter sp.]
MNSITQRKVQTFIDERQLLKAGDLVVVGVSGGTDSVALLHILDSLRYKCIVAHCNFHLRMDDSLRDELFVRNLAKTRNLEFHSIDFKTVEYSKQHGISVEMAARELRYEWFYQLLEKTGAQAIAIAHHADDSIETVLMNLVRGTSLKGLTGIPARNRQVVRPLLCLTRDEIENYLREQHLEHVEDTTNAENDYQRNKFRNEVIPLLEKINPAVRSALYSNLEHFEGNFAIYQQAIEQIKNKVSCEAGGTIVIDIANLKQQIHARTVLFELLSAYGFNPAVIGQVYEQLDADPGKTFLSPAYRLVKDRNVLIVSKLNSDSNETAEIGEHDLQINYPLCLKVNKFAKTSGFNVSKSKDCVHFDARKLVFPLTIRHWQEGDYFFPFGMKQRKKLSDYFIDRKFSLVDKEECWLLVSGDDIVWIVGERTDDRFKITEQTSEIVEFRIEKDK